MKVVRSLDHVDTKKIDRLLELEPELVALIQDHKAQKAANKITRKFAIGFAIIAGITIGVYITNLLNAVGGV